MANFRFHKISKTKKIRHICKIYKNSPKLMKLRKCLIGTNLEVLRNYNHSWVWLTISPSIFPFIQH